MPRFSNRDIAQALAAMRTCIVVDKGAINDIGVTCLSESGVGVWQGQLGLEAWGPGGGIIAPGTPMPGDRELEPVRVLGYAAVPPNKRKKPLLHAKIAVCCAAWTWEHEAGGSSESVTPMNVWLGSANWTTGTFDHIEFGAWSSDRAICEHVFAFMCSVIEASEPVTGSATDPTPELAPGEYDDDAFYEYFAEYGGYDSTKMMQKAVTAKRRTLE